jgi:hypothetical protein
VSIFVGNSVTYPNIILRKHSSPWLPDGGFKPFICRIVVTLKQDGVVFGSTCIGNDNEFLLDEVDLKLLLAGPILTLFF